VPCSSNSKDRGQQQQQPGTSSRPSTSLKKSNVATSAAVQKVPKAKRPKQTATLSAIINSPRQTKLGGASSALKRSTEEASGAMHRSERKQTANQNLKDKLKTFKQGKVDSVLS